MEVTEAHHGAGRVELGLLDGHAIRRRRVQHGEELAALHELEEHVQPVRVLVRVVQAEDERVVAQDHDVFLVHHVLLLAVRDDLALVHRLERERLAARLALHQLDAPEGARAEHGDDLEVFELDVLSRGLQDGLVELGFPLDRLALHDVLEGAKGLGEILSREHEALGGLDRGDRSVPLVRFQQSRLAEMPARLDLIHLGRRATVRFNHHLGGASLDDVKGVALRALLDNVLALAILHKREEPRRLEPLLLLYRERERERAKRRVRTGTRRARRSRSQNSR